MEEETTQFLEALFGQKPERAAVQVWIRSQPAKTWVLDKLKDASRLAVESGKDHDAYIACGLAPNAESRALRTRLKANEVIGIPGVWADIDVNGGPDAKDGAAPTTEAALELANELLQPTLIVASGYGIQGWWLWEDGPWIFHERRDQEQARRIVAGFQGALRAAARRLGWSLDATQDLSRVMRIPGTYNHKGEVPAPVELLAYEGSRYSIEEVGELGQGFLDSISAESAALESGEAIQIKIRAKPPLDSRVVELRDEEPEFEALWRRKVGKGSPRKDWSMSEFEFSICNWLVRAGLEPQGICDALVSWRNSHEPGDPRRKLRAERIATTIGKVMRTVEVEKHVSMAETVRDNAVELLDHVAHGFEKASEPKVLGAFNRIIGGPAISRLKQYSRDPQTARFTIELDDGREVNLGTFDSIASQMLFRKSYGIVTGHYPPAVGQAKWDKAVAGLLKAAVVEDDTEDSRLGVMRGWINDYLEAAASNDRDGACISQSPFIEEEAVHISLAHFTKWLKRVQGERVDASDVALQMRVLKFQRRTIGYANSDKATGRSTRSYFVGPEVLLSENLAETP